MAMAITNKVLSSVTTSTSYFLDCRVGQSAQRSCRYSGSTFVQLQIRLGMGFQRPFMFVRSRLHQLTFDSFFRFGTQSANIVHFLDQVSTTCVPTFISGL